MGKQNRFNLGVGRKITEDILKSVEFGSKNQRFSKKATISYDALKKYIQNAPNSRKEVLEYLIKRFEAEGDQFARITNFGHFNEIIAGIQLGVYNNKWDVLLFDAADNIPGRDIGDLHFRGRIRAADGSLEMATLDAQVKGTSSEFHIPPSTRLLLSYKTGKTLTGRVEVADGAGNTVKEYYKNVMIKDAADYLTEILPPRSRIVNPIYSDDPLQGSFDMGLGSFRVLMKKKPQLFALELPTSAKSDYVFQDVSRWKKYVTEGISAKSGANGAKEQAARDVLEDMLRIDFDRSEEYFDVALGQILQAAREHTWYKKGKIRYRYKNVKPFLDFVNPLIQTGISRYDNHEPFYRLIKKLYKTTDIKEARLSYLRDTDTLANKLPNAYYNNVYEDINY